MKYKMGYFDGYYNKFFFENGYYVNINLASQYPKYKLPQDGHAHKSWHYTIIENNNETIKEIYKIGNIILFNKENLRKIKAVPNIFTLNNIVYRKTNNYEYDKYIYNNDLDNDNSKLYIYMNHIYETYIKKPKELLVI